MTASGGGYDNITKDIDVSVTDNDTAALTVSATDLDVTEGASTTFTVRLATLPSGDVTVSLAQTGTNNPDVTFDTDAGTANDQHTLNFTADNWNQTQMVTVNAAEDDDASNDSATLRLTPSGGGYGDDQAASITIRVIDDERFRPEHFEDPPGAHGGGRRRGLADLHGGAQQPAERRCDGQPDQHG